MICAFITERREEFGVVPICRALTELGVPIAPRTYYAHIGRPPSKRALWDTVVTELLAGIYEPGEQGWRPPESLYGAVKIWAYLQRQGVPVARSTIERIMRANGWRGAVRGKGRVVTTIADPTHARAPDLVKRRFKVARPNTLWVADFTYVHLAGGGFVYTAFVIDAFAGYIVGWECSATKHTAFVQAAIRQAVSLRARQGHPLQGGPSSTVHHSDAGSQYTALRCGETLLLAGLTPSVGTVGDALDNALAETTIGLYKTECIRDGSPFRTGPLTTLADVEETTSAWVHWYNTRRLMHRLGRRPPAEAETDHYTQPDAADPAAHRN